MRMFKLSNDDEDDITTEERSTWSDEWKVLVYDADTRAVISPLLTVGELRSLGVTLHLNIDGPRDIIPDVSAVYFVRPTASNAQYIADDAAAARYREFFVNFVTPIPRPLLEQFARSCVEGAAVPRIKRVIDQYLSFVALEARLFHLNHKDSYTAYARPDATEADITSYGKSLATSLLGVCACTGILPVIVAQPNGPAAMVADALDAIIRDHINSPGSGIFGHAASGLAAGSLLPGGRRPTPMPLGPGGRPCLLLLDRGLDLATPLAHSSSYAGLVDDTLGPLALNRVVVPDGPDASTAGAGAAAAPGQAAGWLGDILGGGSKAKASKGRPISLDSESDAFWRAHACDEFPSAIEAHEKELQETLSREEAIRKTAGASAGADDALASAALGMGGSDSSASDLVSAIDSLPALLKRRKILEAHTTLLSGVMSRVAARILPTFYDAEAPGLMVGSSAVDRAAVLELVRDGSKGNLEDRARLACVHMLTCTPGAGAAGSGGSGGPAGLPLAPPSSRGFVQDAKEECETLIRALTTSVREGAGANGGPAADGASPAAAGAGGDAASAPLPPALQAELDRAVAALRYACFLRTSAAMGSGGLMAGGSGGSGGLLGMAASAAGAMGLPAGGAGGRLLAGVAAATSNILSKAAAQVRQLVAGESRLPVTRTIAAVAEGRLSGGGVGPGLDQFLVYDPRSGTGPAGPGSGNVISLGSYVQAQQAAAQSALSSGAALPQGGPGFRGLITFMVGGGSYSEYVDCQRYATAVNATAASQGGLPTTIVYGATEMLRPVSFLDTLAGLGKGLR